MTGGAPPRWDRTRRALRAAGLLPAAHRLAYALQRSALALRREPDTTAADGLPLPPARLRFLVSGTADSEYFLKSGRRDAATIRTALEVVGTPLEQVGSLLDFGVGCGRIARRWRSLEAVEVHGTDTNPRLVAWCREHLRFGKFAVSSDRPPLPYEEGAFGLVYAFSVFTHLPEDLQGAWMEELARVARPGGHLLVTLHGETLAREHLSGPDLDRFRRSGFAVVSHGPAGSNLCNAFHSVDYATGVLGRGLEPVHVAAESAGVQDLYVFRRGSRSA